MRTILAGWIAGYIMAISVTVAMSWLIVKTSANTSKSSILGSDVDSRIAYVFIHLGASLACTILGLIVGTIYHITVIRQVGVHSFEPLFLIGVLVLTLVSLILLAALWPKRWLLWITQSVVFVAVFGLLVPFLASR
tara:strand:+ start:104 stop:511 length:408 start_codon:yes stop_codon:yes gene_type:complete